MENLDQSSTDVHSTSYEILHYGNLTVTLDIDTLVITNIITEFVVVKLGNGKFFVRVYFYKIQ